MTAAGVNDNYLKVLRLKLFHSFLSYHDRVCFCVAKRQQQLATISRLLKLFLKIYYQDCTQQKHKQMTEKIQWYIK